MIVKVEVRAIVDFVGAPCGPPCTPKMFTNVVTNPENALTSPAKNKLVNSHSTSFFLMRQSQRVARPFSMLHTKPRASLSNKQ